MENTLSMLLGAALVAIGVLAAALADRIRGLRISRDAAPRERASRAASIAVPAQATRATIPVVDTAELHHSAVPKQPRTSRPEPKVTANTDSGDDSGYVVIDALVAAGYKKSIATEATWACSAVERATIEDWTRAALAKAGRSFGRA